MGAEKLQSDEKCDVTLLWLSSVVDETAYVAVEGHELLVSKRFVW